MSDNLNLLSGSSSTSASLSQSQSKSRKRKQSQSKSKSKSRKQRKRYLYDDAEINAYLENRYRVLIPGPVLRQRHNDLIEKVKSLIKARYLNAKVLVYGSALSETALISSDIDFSVYVKTESPEYTVSQIAELLKKGNFKNVEERHVDDRVGIFCYHEENESKTYIDLTLNNKVGRRTSKLIRSVVDVNLRVKMLVVLVKEFSKCYKIDDPKTGTLKSVGYTYMIVLVLQLNNLLPKFFNKDATDEFAELIAEVDAYKHKFDEVSNKSGNTSTLQLLRTFFHYYNEDHDFENDAISIIGGQVVSKQSLGWGGGEQKYTLAIVDPFGDQNIGRTVSYEGIDRIKEAFTQAEIILAGIRPHDLFKPVADSQDY